MKHTDSTAATEQTRRRYTGAEIRRIGVRADVHPRTVARILAGGGRVATARRVHEAIVALGLGGDE